MASRPNVIRDVSIALKEEIIDNSPFDRTTYNVDLVPSAEPPKGWGAKNEAWGLLLEWVAVRLHKIDPEYQRFRPTKPVITSSWKQPVRATIGNITELIMKTK